MSFEHSDGLEHLIRFESLLSFCQPGPGTVVRFLFAWWPLRPSWIKRKRRVSVEAFYLVPQLLNFQSFARDCMQSRLKQGNSSEPPAVSNYLLREHSFERILRSQPGPQGLEEVLVLPRIFVWKNDSL